MQTDVKQYYAKNSGLAVGYATRLKSVTVTSATSSLRNFCVCDPTINQSGTYARTSPSGVTTITMTAHGLETGDRVFLNFTSGDAIDAVLEVTKLNANSFTVTTPNTTTTSGNVTIYTDILVEFDSYSTIGFSVTIPGQGIYCKNGIFIGLGGSVTGTIYHG